MKRKRQGQSGKTRHKKQSAAWTTRKILPIAIVAVLLVGVAAVWIWRGTSTLDLGIGGLTVTREEYLQMLDTQTYETSKALTEQYGLQSGPDFWLQKAGETEAYRVLADRTVATLREHRALYSLAKEQGYVEDISYAALLKRVEDENRERAEKQARGETVYGLSSFTVDTFLKYEEDAIRKRYCDGPANPGMYITEEAARAKYGEMKEGYFQRSDSVSLTWFKIEYKALGLDKATLSEKLDALGSQGGALYTLAADSELALYLEQRSLDYSDYRTASVEMPDVLELADNLSAGERTAVIDQNGILYLVECTARMPGGYTPYEEARDYVLQTAREDAFGTLIARRAAETSVTGSMETVYSTTKKEVQ